MQDPNELFDPQVCPLRRRCLHIQESKRVGFLQKMWGVQHEVCADEVQWGFVVGECLVFGLAGWVGNCSRDWVGNWVGMGCMVVFEVAVEMVGGNTGKVSMAGEERDSAGGNCW